MGGAIQLTCVYVRNVRGSTANILGGRGGGGCGRGGGILGFLNLPCLPTCPSPQIARYQAMVDEAVRGRDAKAAELEAMQAGLAALTADMQVWGGSLVNVPPS